MANDFIKFGFTAGVLSPAFKNRSDMEAFTFGLDDAENCFVEYQGGASTRPGLKFGDFTASPQRGNRIFQFSFNNDEEDNYLLVFRPGRVEIMQSGSYLVETAQVVTAITAADPAVITIAGHGYTNKDMVYLLDGVHDDFLFTVANATTNTFTLKSVAGGNHEVDYSALPAYVSGATVQKVVSVVTEYLTADLPYVWLTQYRDTVILTCPGFARQIITRSSGNVWSITKTNDYLATNSPTALAFTASTSGTAEAMFAVTAVMPGGIEAPVEEVARSSSMVNYAVTEGQVRISWTATAGALGYNVYRSVIYPKVNGAHRGADLGFIGYTTAARFTDPNIIPDFTRAPPFRSSPFVDGAVTQINITAGGSGYTDSSTVTITTGTGTGFSGKPIISYATGAIVGVLIFNPGKGYLETDTVAFAVAGSSATGAIVVTPAGGNSPYVSAIQQQRVLFGGTANSPLGIFGSASGIHDDFSQKTYLTGSDSFSYELDDENQNPIRAIVPAPEGFFVFTGSNVTLIRGIDDNIILAGNLKAVPQFFPGAERTRPERIGREIFYVDAASGGIRGISTSNLPGYFEDTNASILSAHFFSSDNRVIKMAWARNPHSVLWCVLADGTALSFTYEKEHSVRAWMPHKTQGEIIDVAVVKEGFVDRVYFLVNRRINDKDWQMVESLADRRVTTIDQSRGLDCFLETGKEYPDADIRLVPDPDETNVIINANGSVFTAGHVGQVIRVQGGRGVISSQTGNAAVAVFDVMAEGYIPYTTRFQKAYSGSWYLSPVVTSLSGLGYLEGETVSIFADGVSRAPVEVVDGTIALGGSYSEVAVGLDFAAHVTLLPISTAQTVIEGRVGNISEVIIRLNETVQANVSVDGSTSAYPVYRTGENTFERFADISYDMVPVSVRGTWEIGQKIRIDKVDAAPFTVYGVVITAEIGDDD